MCSFSVVAVAVAVVSDGDLVFVVVSIFSKAAIPVKGENIIL